MRTTRRPALLLAVLLLATSAACSNEPGASVSTDAREASTDRDHDGQVDPFLESIDDSDDGSHDGDAESGFADDSDDDDPQSGVGTGARGLRMRAFDDCSTYLDYVKGEARDRVGPYGLDPYGGPWGPIATRAVEESAAASEQDLAAPSATVVASTDAAMGGDDGDSGSGPNVTGTNTQEAGVDEPDIIKSDGTRIVTITENVLSVVDITGPEPVVTGRLTLTDGWGNQLFLAGDRAILLTNSGQWDSYPADVAVAAESGVADDSIAPWPMGSPAAVITEIDLGQPEPQIVTTMRIEGQYLNAREIGGQLMLAVSSGPQWMPWLYPQTEAGEERARQANQDMINDSTLEDWTPQYVLDHAGSASEGNLLSCEQLQRPADFSGFDVISVLAIDLSQGIAAGVANSTAAGVLAGGQTVYASLDRFYVATTKWAAAEIVNDVDGQRFVEWSEDYTTDLHAFTVPTDGTVAYIGSGSVDGTLLNSFSLDEHNGFLRVITTDGSPWNDRQQSETQLTVFQEQGNRLVPVGQVGGLGKGESLYSARLIGDRGFAVTFRQIDPFYVLDLSDPAAPRVTGELKIPGFSTYLHPVAEHRVLGVGKAATEEGQVTGLKLSLFDVADPANPVEIATWTMDNAQSAAEFDSHAFQMIGSTLILPVQEYADGFNGAIVFEINDSIVERGRISHVAPDEQPTSDCRELVESDVADTSSAYWIAADTYSRAQLCQPGQTGGFGNWYCDVIPVDQFGNWFGDSGAVADELTAVAGGELDRLEVCYPDGGWSDAIQRTIVVDSTLWTMSAQTLQANDFASLTTLGTVELR